MNMKSNIKIKVRVAPYVGMAKFKLMAEKVKWNCVRTERERERERESSVFACAFNLIQLWMCIKTMLIIKMLR